MAWKAYIGIRIGNAIANYWALVQEFNLRYHNSRDL